MSSSTTGNSISICPPSTSTVFSHQLALPDTLRAGLSCAEDVNGVRWWPITPTQIGNWCSNRHGTFHGGLTMALLLTLCKYHVQHSTKSHGNTHPLYDNDNVHVSQIHAQFMDPIELNKAFWVCTRVDEGVGGTIHGEAEVHLQRGRTQRPRCRVTVIIQREKASHL